MKKQSIHLVFILSVFALLLSSCSISNQSMKTPNYHIEFYKTDFDYSEQVTAEAQSVRVLMIDWKRLFKWQSGQIESDRFNTSNNVQLSTGTSFVFEGVVGSLSTVVPVLGDYGKGKVSSYALYKLMQENSGYDVVIYPRYETKRFIIPVFYSKRTVKVTARLGKIK